MDQQEINQQWIDQQRAICNAATPGMWEVDLDGGMGIPFRTIQEAASEGVDLCIYSSTAKNSDGEPCYVAQTDYDTISRRKEENPENMERMIADTIFISDARTALPAALDALEASMQREAEKDAEIERLTAELDAAISDCSGYCATCGFFGDCAINDHNDTSPPTWFHGDCDDWEWRGLCADNAPEGAQPPRTTYDRMCRDKVFAASILSQAYNHSDYEDDDYEPACMAVLDAPTGAESEYPT